ncbi:MAG: hypothetical protein KJ725_20545, partial [Gammaproteobacteria bacterium]|nr:hypothetical protein [Gammaproteobacteria bacterium]
HEPSTIYVREIVARGAKETRHEPVASLYEKGRVSHLKGEDFGELEDAMTTWEPSPWATSPNELDALSQGAWELAGLGDAKPHPSVGFKGLEKMGRALAKQAPAAVKRGAASAVIGRLGRAQWGSKL